MGSQIVFRITDRSIGLIGLCITIIGLFLPWWIWQTVYYPLREQVYATVASIYPYYPIYEIGITGPGWQSSLATLLAAYALFTETKRRPGFLSVSSLMIFYNVGSNLAMFFMYYNDYYYYYAPVLGPGIFVSLIGGILLLISALLGVSKARKKEVSFCKKCGSSLLNSYQFCPYCGEGIDHSHN